MRVIYTLIGALIGAATDLAINLLAAAIQQRTFGEQFSQHAIGWLIGLIGVGLLLGLWLGATVRLQPKENAATQTTTVQRHLAQPIMMTRFRALLSYGRLRGQGIVLTDILLVGSVLVIDSRG